MNDAEWQGYTKAKLESISETSSRIEKHLVKMDDRIDIHAERIRCIETRVESIGRWFKISLAAMSTGIAAVSAWLKFRG